MSTEPAKHIYFTPEEALQKEIIESLSKSQKELSCKFFYDEKGSKLFDKIVELEEYYLTRTEELIMNENILEICQTIGKDSLLVEPGSGNSAKVKKLLDNLEETAGYIPIDISEYYVNQASSKISSEYPGLRILPVIADYTQEFDLPEINFEYDKLVIFYPGSTIGNFKPSRAKNFLNRINRMCGKQNYLLIGIDLIKEKKIIENAYNDKQGITEEFNLNLLNNLNNTVGTDFDTGKWEHLAFFNEDENRIEMHLKSREDQKVRINGSYINFKKGETIHTENSYKYSIEQFSGLVEDFYTLQKFWTDDEEKFGVLFFRST